MNSPLKGAIKKKHGDMLKWLLNISKQPRYYVTDNQVYVHAGILEEADDWWKQGTHEKYFTQKYPADKHTSQVYKFFLVDIHYFLQKMLS